MHTITAAFIQSKLRIIFKLLIIEKLREIFNILHEITAAFIQNSKIFLQTRKQIE